MLELPNIITQELVEYRLGTTYVKFMTHSCFRHKREMYFKLPE